MTAYTQARQFLTARDTRDRLSPKETLALQGTHEGDAAVVFVDPTKRFQRSRYRNSARQTANAPCGRILTLARAMGIRCAGRTLIVATLHSAITRTQKSPVMSS